MTHHVPQMNPLRLLQEIQCVLSTGDRIAEFGLQPGISAREATELAAAREDQQAPGRVVWIFYHVNGQSPGSRPLVVDRGWRLVSLAEALDLRREHEPQGDERNWLPLFVDRDGEVICATGETRAPLRTYRGDEALPTLSGVLSEVLEQLGGDTERFFEPPIEGSLAELCEELDLLIEHYGRPGRDDPRFNPGVREADLADLVGAYGELPDEITALLRWHDGQGDAPEGVRVARVNRDFPALLLSAQQMLEVPETHGGWDADWLPLARGKTSYLVYLLRGQQSGALIAMPIEGGPVRLVSPSLRQFLGQAVRLHRQYQETRDAARALPANFAPSNEQRWLLGLCGVLAQINDEHPLLLGGGRRMVAVQPSLRALDRWWGITERGAAIESLEALLQPHEEALAEGNPAANSVAWDCGRAAWVAGQAYVCALLPAAEAWSYTLRAGCIVRAVYSCWEDYGLAYAEQRLEWASEARGSDEAYVRATASDSHTAVRRLLGPGGAWSNLPWPVELEASAAPLPEPTRVRVISAAELSAACREACSGTHILLAPGDYRASVTLRADLRLEGEEGVRWVPEPEGPCVTVHDDHCVEVVGIDFRARGLGLGEHPTAIVAEDGLLRIERCSFLASAQAVLVQGAVAYLEDCRFARSLAALDATAASKISLERCYVEGARSNAIGIVGEANAQETWLHARTLTVAGSDAHCVLAEHATVRIEDGVLAGSQRAALGGIGASITGVNLRIDAAERGLQLVGGTLEVYGLRATTCHAGVELHEVEQVVLRALELNASSSSALVVRACRGKSLWISDATLEGGALSLVEVTEVAAPIRFSDCRFGTSPEWYGLQLSRCPQVLVERSTFQPSARATLWTLESQAELRDCTFLPGGAEAWSVQRDSSVWAVACTMTGFDDTGIFIARGSHVTCIDCVIANAAGHGIVTHGQLEVRGLQLRGVEGISLAVKADGQAMVLDSVIDGGVYVLLELADEPEENEGEPPRLLLHNTTLSNPTHSGICVQVGEATLVSCSLPHSDVFGKAGRTRVFRCDITDGDTAGITSYGGLVEVVGGSIGAQQLALQAEGGRISVEKTRLLGGTEGIYEAIEGGHIELMDCVLVPGEGGLGKEAGVSVAHSPARRTLLPRLTRSSRGVSFELTLPRSESFAGTARLLRKLEAQARSFPMEEHSAGARELMLWTATLEAWGRILLGDDNRRWLWSLDERLGIWTPDEAGARRVFEAYDRWVSDPVLLDWTSSLAESALNEALPWQRVVQLLARSGPRGFVESMGGMVRGHPVRRSDLAVDVLVQANWDVSRPLEFIARREALAECLGEPTEVDDVEGRARWVVDDAAITLQARESAPALAASISWLDA